MEKSKQKQKQRKRNESERNCKMKKLLLMDFNSLRFFEFSILITVILISSNLMNKWSERRWVGHFFRWSSKYLSSLYGFNSERMTLWLLLVFIRFVRSIHLLFVGIQWNVLFKIENFTKLYTLDWTKTVQPIELLSWVYICAGMFSLFVNLLIRFLDFLWYSLELIWFWIFGWNMVGNLVSFTRISVVFLYLNSHTYRTVTLLVHSWYFIIFGAGDVPLHLHDFTRENSSCCCWFLFICMLVAIFIYDGEFIYGVFRHIFFSHWI